MYSVHIWSVITATIISFAIGAIWYSPALFGREWMAHLRVTDADIAKTSTTNMVWRYIWQLIVSIIMFIIVAFAIASIGAYTGRDGAIIGLLAWIGFIMPSAVGGMLWENKTFKITLITSACSLLSLVVGSAIIGSWV